MSKLRTWSVLAFACLIVAQAALPGRADELEAHRKLAQSVVERLLAVAELPEVYDGELALRIVNDGTAARLPSSKTTKTASWSRCWS
jgi:hypothetical protein